MYLKWVLCILSSRSRFVREQSLSALACSYSQPLSPTSRKSVCTLNYACYYLITFKVVVVVVVVVVLSQQLYFQIFDFKLSDDEMSSISSLNKNKRIVTLET